MKLEYFSAKGVENVIAKYKNEIGKYFLFDNSGVKRQLSDIVYGNSICQNGYLVLFVSENLQIIQINSFMKINDLQYDFEDFEHLDFEIE